MEDCALCGLPDFMSGALVFIKTYATAMIQIMFICNFSNDNGTYGNVFDSNNDGNENMGNIYRGNGNDGYTVEKFICIIQRESISIEKYLLQRYVMTVMQYVHFHSII